MYKESNVEKHLAATVVCWAALGSMAMAHDLVQPDWRGDPYTTFQEWRFDTGANPAVPESYDNEYGQPSAEITPGFLSEGWFEQLPGFFGTTQTGYWDLGGAEGEMALTIDNYNEARPYKEIWVQVTYYGSFPYSAPSVTVPGATLLDSQPGLVVENVPGGGIWLLDQSIWRIEPNPTDEQILIESIGNGLIIDQVIVDTICVPEPTSLAGLMVVAGLMWIRRRR